MWQPFKSLKRLSGANWRRYEETAGDASTPGFRVRLIIVIPSLANAGCRFHPVCLFGVFHVRIAKDDVRAAVVPVANDIVLFVQGAGYVSVLVGQLRVIANGNHIARHQHPRLFEASPGIISETAGESERHFVRAGPQCVVTVSWILPKVRFVHTEEGFFAGQRNKFAFRPGKRQEKIVPVA